MKPELPLSSAFLEAHLPKIQGIFDRYEKTDHLHPTLLITGLEGVGKRSIALHLLQALFCDRTAFAKPSNEDDEAPQDNLFGDALAAPASPETKTQGFTSCGECRSCIRAKNNQWLDLYWLEPTSTDEEARVGVHKIDAFREIISKQGMGPTEEPFKVVLIADADRMTPQAANSILKTLEEPPKNWVFILTASDSSRLLPTILSRCMEVKLAPLSSEVLSTVMKEKKLGDQKRIEIAARAAQGSLTRAFSFLDEDLWDTRNQFLGLLTHPAGEWMKLIESLSQSQKKMLMGMDLVESLFSDLLQHYIQGASYEWTHRDQQAFLIQWMESKYITPDQIHHILHHVAEKRRLATLTLNSKLLAQEVLAPIVELACK